jgi:hypothetical protein
MLPNQLKAPTQMSGLDVLFEVSNPFTRDEPMRRKTLWFLYADPDRFFREARSSKLETRSHPDYSGFKY